MILSRFSLGDRDRLHQFTTRLRHDLDRRGLSPDHVPALLPATADKDHLPPPEQWRVRSHAAIALHMLINAGPGVPSSSKTCHAFGTADTENSLLLDGIRLGRGLRPGDAHLLDDGLHALLRGGLVDYQRRRDTLRALTHLPTHASRRLRHENHTEYPWHWLTLGWIWTRLTHGPVWTGRWLQMPEQAIRDFDTRIDPETRLVLLQTGEQILAEADPTLTITPAATTTTRRKRSG